MEVCLNIGNKAEPDQTTEITVCGVGLDEQTRCLHYHSALDVVAIRLKCCSNYYSCHRCHEEMADHAPVRWLESDFSEPAVLCGVCRTKLSVTDYLSCNDACPHCEARFNPGCRKHRHLYFEGKLNS